VDEASPVKRNNAGVRQSSYTVAEAAKVLGVGQRRILEMLQTKEIAGEQDPISSRWKISKHAVHERAQGKPTDSNQPLPSDRPPAPEQDTVEVRTTEETQAAKESADDEELLPAPHPPREVSAESSSEEPTEKTRERIDELEHLNERLHLEQQAEKAAWEAEKESLLAAADRERQHAEALQGEVTRLRTEQEATRERIGELEHLNEHLRLEQQAEKATWKEEEKALLAAANRELQHAEELRKEIARLSIELEATQERAAELERLNERRQLKQQAEKAAWQEEKESLLSEIDQQRQHAEELQSEVGRLTAELENERRKSLWQRLYRARS
jgi:excisionase family DNA binding protein